jgi:hypothetical protein
VLDPLHPFVQFANVLAQLAYPMVQLVVSAFVLLFAVVALYLLGLALQVLGLFVQPGRMQVVGGDPQMLDALCWMRSAFALLAAIPMTLFHFIIIVVVIIVVVITLLVARLAAIPAMFLAPLFISRFVIDFTDSYLGNDVAAIDFLRLDQVDPLGLSIVEGFVQQFPGRFHVPIMQQPHGMMSDLLQPSGLIVPSAAA